MLKSRRSLLFKIQNLARQKTPLSICYCSVLYQFSSRLKILLWVSWEKLESQKTWFMKFKSQNLIHDALNWNHWHSIFKGRLSNYLWPVFDGVGLGMCISSISLEILEFCCLYSKPSEIKSCFHSCWFFLPVIFILKIGRWTSKVCKRERIILTNVSLNK